MKRPLLLIILFLSALNVFSQSKIEIGEKHKIFSTVLKEERAYWVYLPPNYNDTIYAPESYPVVYFLDGDRHFHSITGVQDFLSKGPYASLPQMIYVGVLTTKNRSRDLTPTNVNTSQTNKHFNFPDSGGNENFMKFLSSELILKINKKYRTNGYKTLIGHSFGGLTVLNTLITTPKLFNAYVAIDPSVWWDDQHIIKKASKKLSYLNLKGIKLFLTQGYDKPIGNDTSEWHEKAIQAFKRALENNNASGLQWDYRFFKDEDHGTVSLPSEYYGLRYIYDGYQIEVKTIADNPELYVKAFEELSNKLGFEIKPAESKLDWLASYCLKTKKIDQAIQLLKLNQKYYPDSINTYIILGDLYVEISDLNKAKQEYQKALKINPKSQLVIKKIEQINN
tara:strand:- start:35201 stop:36382 length:1182 start_codon:yes stop_codon:yes gene_type:complete